MQHRPPAEEPDDDYPFYLTTGRLLAHYQSGTQTRRVPALLEAAPQPFVQVHPSAADTLGIAHGDLCAGDDAARHGATGALICPAPCAWTRCLCPFHYPGTGRVNLLTNPALDPVSRMPEFKVCARGPPRKGHQMLEKPAFIQGTFSATGQGLDTPVSLLAWCPLSRAWRQTRSADLLPRRECVD